MPDRITSALNKRSSQPASLTEVISRAMLGKSTFGQALNQIKTQDLGNLTAEMNLDLNERRQSLAEQQFDHDRKKFKFDSKTDNQKSFEDRFAFWSEGLSRQDQVRLFQYAEEQPDKNWIGNADTILSGGIGELGLKVPEKPQKKSVTPIKVADPTSATGFSWKVPATGENLGDAPPTGGLSVKFDPRTGKLVEVRTGGGADLTTGTKSKLQDTQRKTADALSGVRRIRSSFKPEYQQLSTRWDAMVTAVKEKVEGVPVLEWLGDQFGESDRELLRDFTVFKRRAFANMNKNLHELSGAAVNEHEFDRLKKQMPNPGTGLFDGDSPSQFDAKMKDVEYELRVILARYNYSQKLGKEPWDIDLLEMEAVLNNRWDEIEQSLPRELSGEERNIQADILWREEFGI